MGEIGGGIPPLDSHEVNLPPLGSAQHPPTEEGATGIQSVDDLDPVTAAEVPAPQGFEGSFEQVGEIEVLNESVKMKKFQKDD